MVSKSYLLNQKKKKKISESKITPYDDNVVFKVLNFNFLRHLKEILNDLEGLNPSIAAGIDNISQKFLKDRTDILTRPIFQLCNISS